MYFSLEGVLSHIQQCLGSTTGFVLLGGLLTVLRACEHHHFTCCSVALVPNLLNGYIQFLILKLLSLTVFFGHFRTSYLGLE